MLSRDVANDEIQSSSYFASIVVEREPGPSNMRSITQPIHLEDILQPVTDLHKANESDKKPAAKASESHVQEVEKNTIKVCSMQNLSRLWITSKSTKDSLGQMVE